LASAFGEPRCNGTEILGASDPLSNTAGLGTILHEYLHGFGLVDMYDQDIGGGDPKIPIGGTGRYDIMSNSHGWDRNDRIPGHPAAFSRLKVPGWLDPILIEADGYYAIQPAEISGHIYKISHGFPDGEYLLIENRQPIKWDSNWPAQCGIVIYHVDEAMKRQNHRGYPGHPNWPTDHYMVSVLQADGLYDIEKGVNLGDEGDFWKNGDVLGPGGNFPNTDSIQGGVQKETGVKITIMSDPGFIMTFQVEGIGSGVNTTLKSNRIDSNNILDGYNDPNTVGGTLAWSLSMLFGSAAMVGVLVLVL
jgi:hypothetical protein